VLVWLDNIIIGVKKYANEKHKINMLYVTSEGINIFPVKHIAGSCICVKSLFFPNIIRINVKTEIHIKNTAAFSIVDVNMEINSILIHMINGA
jgi:hypothetical protein